jgi:hypothetical protein
MYDYAQLFKPFDDTSRVGVRKPVVQFDLHTIREHFVSVRLIHGSLAERQAGDVLDLMNRALRYSIQSGEVVCPPAPSPRHDNAVGAGPRACPAPLIPRKLIHMSALSTLSTFHRRRWATRPYPRPLKDGSCTERPSAPLPPTPRCESAF